VVKTSHSQIHRACSLYSAQGRIVMAVKGIYIIAFRKWEIKLTEVIFEE
jgi:hypothetical protein